MTIKEFNTIDWTKVLTPGIRIGIMGLDFSRAKDYVRNIIQPQMVGQFFSITNNLDSLFITLNNYSSIRVLRPDENDWVGVYLDELFLLNDIPGIDYRLVCKKLTKINRGNDPVVEINFAEIAKETWQTTYPERRKWEELGEDTQAEWVRFCENCIAAYLKYEK